MWTFHPSVNPEAFRVQTQSGPRNHLCCPLSTCGGCLPPFKQSLANMPLFNKKFESKPIPVRQGRCNTGHPVATEDLDDFRQISLTLGNKELRFADGIWMHSSRKGDVDDMLRLNRKFRALEEENNMCNLKIEVMLDLLAEHATELNELKPKEK